MIDKQTMLDLLKEHDRIDDYEAGKHLANPRGAVALLRKDHDIIINDQTNKKREYILCE